MAFGLDRLVTVRVVEFDRNEHGESVETNHDSRRWATRIDQSNARTLASYGALSEQSRVYRCRWYDRLANANPTAVRVIDGVKLLTGTNITEVEGGRQSERRRRFIDIEVTAASP